MSARWRGALEGCWSGARDGLEAGSGGIAVRSRRPEVAMEFKILGPLVVRHPDGDARLRAAKPRALLARLLVPDGRPVRTDRLVEDLWDGHPPRSAVPTLQTYMSQ